MGRPSSADKTQARSWTPTCDARWGSWPVGVNADCARSHRLRIKARPQCEPPNADANGDPGKTLSGAGRACARGHVQGGRTGRRTPPALADRWEGPRGNIL
eukprot:3257414-Alexandrium_andersonii.AAC.1